MELIHPLSGDHDIGVENPEIFGINYTGTDGPRWKSGMSISSPWPPPKQSLATTTDKSFDSTTSIRLIALPAQRRLKVCHRRPTLQSSRPMSADVRMPFICTNLVITFVK